MTFHVMTMSTYGKGLSGGDRIWIEVSKRIGKEYPVFVYLWEEGKAIAEREELKNVNFVLWSAKKWARFGFQINYFARIFIAIFNSLFLKFDNSSSTIIYSASEFWQDSLPSLVLKLRFPKIKWVAAWYQTAPDPLRGYSEKEDVVRHPFKAFLYWFVQLPIKPIIKRFADLVIVNNDNEKRQFPQMAKTNKVFVMLGAVDLDRINAYKSKHKRVDKIYDGVFQGRFHPQKGVIELIDIWKIVVEKKPGAKLAVIGDGPLMESVKLKIKKEKLGNNVKLFGYVFDGEEKYKIFSQSKIVLHPALYDSGGMSSAEAMAFGLPAVGFDLTAYQSYYPKGMMKVEIGNLSDLAEHILVLLNNPKRRAQLGNEALRMLETNWSWDGRVKSLLSFLN